MCGICGYVGRDDSIAIRAMTGLLAHRGPDGEGVRVLAASEGGVPVALGHRRLAIIDPSPRGAQPMSYAGGRYWITYNGELYNYRSLRAGLERRGFAFATETDTEVLLAMYAYHGREMLHHLNGIFAFGLWDTEARSLFLARDRLGVKPLYHASHEGVFSFASEVKALLPVLPPARMRTDVLREYLTLLWVPDPDTLFDGIYKLPPGHCATFARGELRITPYWDIEFAPEERPEAEWSDLVAATVRESVQRQMVSDVPLGAFLSGGIDSSAIVAAMARPKNRITTYTIGFSARDLAHEIVPDDIRYARRMGELFDTEYHEEILQPSIVGLLPKLVWHMDEPIADPACISTYLICSAAKDRLTVILSGMGGDELFAGYPRHLAARIGQLLDWLPVATRERLRGALGPHLTLGRPGRLRGPRRNLMKFMRGLDASPLERYLIYCSYYRSDELRLLMADELDTPSHDPLATHRGYARRAGDAHWLNQMLYTDLKTFLPCLNLSYTDKMSMAASTEVRVPLLDDEMVALSARIPPELKLRRMTRKYILKRSMEGTLPRDVIWRPKAGFGAPVRAWLQNDLGPMVSDLLSPSAVKARGLFDPAEVQRLIATNSAGTEDNALRLWALLTLEIWQRTYIDGASAVRRPAIGRSRAALP
ncbi:MAG: asparagine synthase (glutamine-hydrolyzing) [Solirubrobacteraceae bacterium]